MHIEMFTGVVVNGSILHAIYFFSLAPNAQRLIIINIMANYNFFFEFLFMFLDTRNSADNNKIAIIYDL